jgi:hypothetical protein
MSEGKFVPFESPSNPYEGGYQPRTEEERQFEQKIRACPSFEEMYTLLRSRGVVPDGSGDNRSIVEIIKRIEQRRHGHEDPWHRITRTFGLRETVERLLPNDAVYLKELKRSKKSNNGR